MRGTDLSLTQYLKTIERELAAGNATEHTHRTALKALIESLADKIIATNEPQRIKCGAPDYIITRSQIPLGYIEAKDVGISLDKAEKSEQLERYRESLGNLILTDYLEFRWYVRPERAKANEFPIAEHRLTARLASIGNNGKLRIEKDGEKEVGDLLSAFLNAQVPTVQSAKELATRMAKLAQLIRDTIRKAVTEETEIGSLHQQMQGFREVLIHDLTEEQFADMYAQTICYGLFAARCNKKGSEHFTREHAAYDLPKTNPFLRKMFNHIAGPELDERITWAVDDLAELLHRSDISAILEDFGKRTRREDPVVHFYETFLAAYDQKMREARGVYYTPEPVVSYIVRSVDHILKTDFKLPAGLADSSKITIDSPDGNGKTDVHRVLILDPATGTGTFLYSVVNHIFESFKKNLGMWSGYVSENLLPRLFGFELLMAPYAVAHMKLGLLLDQTGYDFQTDERLRVYLTNTLEEAHEVSKLSLFTQWIAEEANEASKIKQEAPVMVVIGNPPYSGHSANVSEWINRLLRGTDTINNKQTGNYFEVDGLPLGERNPKWLNDDYVKFIRFAQWRIEQTGYGVLAFISNHGYLDNPTFRGMRQSLMETFDDIYVLDLHGNSKKKERSPDGSKDENVFDIQQGVAIGIFVKRSGAKKKVAAVRHAHLWGAREKYEEDSHGERVLSGGKYYWLWNHDVSATKWKELQPQSAYYLFIPQDTDLRAEYERGWKITEAMRAHGPGMTTARDHVVIDFESQPIVQRAQLFRDSPESNEELCRQLDIPMKKGWDITRARKLIKAERNLSEHIKPVLYRPFDARSIFYHDSLVWRTVKQTMVHMLTGPNVALITTRQTRDEWDVLASSLIMGHKSLAAYDINSLFPLYLYASADGGKLFAGTRTASSRRANLSSEFIEDFSSRSQMTFVPDGKGDRLKTFGPEDVFDYVYAVFHSPTYRSRYAQFLKIDFPRLPLTSNPELFRKLCTLGSELVGLHLMEKHSTITTYPIAGENAVDKVRYTAPGEAGSDKGRVWINPEQYFEGVPPEVWNFHVGGYQVCQKWLKDRKGRKLTYDDLTHYQRVVSALNETIRLMSEIDEAIEEHGSWPIH
jgi:predicted helicase